MESTSHDLTKFAKRKLLFFPPSLKPLCIGQMWRRYLTECDSNSALSVMSQIGGLIAPPWIINVLSPPPLYVRNRSCLMSWQVSFY